MEISILAVIGIGLAAMFFGYGFGLFEGRGQGYKKRRQEEASDPALKAAMQPPPAPAPVRPAAPVAAPQPLVKSLLRLWLGSAEQPCLELDGTQVNTDQMDAQQRRRLIDL